MAATAAVAPAPTLRSPRVLAAFCVVTLIWGSTWLVIRDQLGAVPASWSVCYRFAVAAVGMAVVAAVRGERLRLPRGGIAFAALLGVLQFALNFNFVYRAEAYVTSGVVAIIFALLIVPNTLLSRLLLKTPVSRQMLAGGAIALTGIALLLVHEARAVRGDAGAVLLGTLLTLAGVLSASAANVMQATPRARALPMLSVLAWAMAIGAAANAAYALATVGAPVMDWRWGYIGGVVYLGLFGSVVAFPLYFSIIRAVGAGPAAWSSVLVPVIAMALSTLAEAYVWSGLSIAGAILAIAGLVVALRRRPA